MAPVIFVHGPIAEGPLCHWKVNPPKTVDVFGFNSLTGQFWGKKMVKNSCVFHFTLVVDDINDKESTIKITQHVGNNETIAKFTKHLCTVISIFRLVE